MKNCKIFLRSNSNFILWNCEIMSRWQYYTHLGTNLSSLIYKLYVLKLNFVIHWFFSYFHQTYISYKAYLALCQHNKHTKVIVITITVLWTIQFMYFWFHSLNNLLVFKVHFILKNKNKMKPIFSSILSQITFIA